MHCKERVCSGLSHKVKSNLASSRNYSNLERSASTRACTLFPDARLLSDLGFLTVSWVGTNSMSDPLGSSSHLTANLFPDDAFVNDFLPPVVDLPQGFETLFPSLPPFEDDSCTPELTSKRPRRRAPKVRHLASVHAKVPGWPQPCHCRRRACLKAAFSYCTESNEVRLRRGCCTTRYSVADWVACSRSRL